LDNTGEQRARAFQHSDPDHPNQRTLAHYAPTWGPLLPEVSSLYAPEWSADERYLVISVVSRGSSDLYAIDTRCEAECERPLWRLPDRSTDDLAPDFSADGSQIVYICRDRGLYNLCLVNTDGSGLRQITRFRGFGFIDSPAWRPR
jgi:Tol biopolymer transport system component